MTASNDVNIPGATGGGAIHQGEGERERERRGGTGVNSEKTNSSAIRNTMKVPHNVQFVKCGLHI